MKQIPVMETIANTYRFTFLHAGTVVGLVWLPVLILTIADYFTAGPFMAGLADVLETRDMAQFGPILLERLAFTVGQFVLLSVIAAAIGRELLRPLERPLFLKVSLSGVELRIAAAQIALALLTLTLVVVSMFVGAVIAQLVGGGPQSPSLAILPVALLAPAIIYIMVRLGSFVVPAAVTGDGLGIEESWKLAQGNVWRLIAVMLAVTVPIILVEHNLQNLVTGAASSAPGNASDLAAQMRFMANELRLLLPHLPVLKGVEFLLAPFYYSLICSAPVFAYKALTEGASGSQE